MQSALQQPTPSFSLTNAQGRAMECLTGGATDIALGGGSRSGKTFLLVRAVLVRALRANNSRHAIVTGKR